jgi:hypothetical protein
MSHQRCLTVVRVLILVLATARPARADEGMWLFDAPPVEQLRQRHGVDLSAAWLEHLRESSVRLSSGGSGSFVSADGLVLTNHHVGSPFIHRLEADHPGLSRDGFLAADRAAELPCRTLELNVLVGIDDVTARVHGAVTPSMTPDEAAAARRLVMAEIEQEAVAASGRPERVRCDVVTLHQGAIHHLYRYRRYTDVRLVFAPERQIAAFGGDADNFEFPRFCLDVCLFRAYEDGRPARVPHHLAWATAPVEAGDVVFVSGHPGHTDRGDTMAELVALRDRVLPFRLQSIQRMESLLAAWCEEGPQERGQAQDGLVGVRNARKNLQGVLAALLDPRIMQARRDGERQIRETLARTGGEAAAAAPFRRIEEAEQSLAAAFPRYEFLEGGLAFNTAFFSNARTILRAAAEGAKPSGERLREYRDSNRTSLEMQLFAEEPLHDRLETAKLADSLTALATALGADDPLVERVLAGQSPRDRAAALVAGTSLGRRADAEPSATARRDTRRELYEGGAAVVARSQDAMLALAAVVDEESRRLRRAVEAAGEIKQQAHAEIARGLFAAEGPRIPPDATFTLRLAYGVVRGLPATAAMPAIAPFTDFAGLFSRVEAKQATPPFDLPPRWSTRREKLQADPGFTATHFNFACTADIVGGNSGSPVVNRKGELVGLIFDGNIDSLVLRIAYDDDLARAVAVDAAGIIAALGRVYAADGLVAELLARETAATGDVR